MWTTPGDVSVVGPSGNAKEVSVYAKRDDFTEDWGPERHPDYKQLVYFFLGDRLVITEDLL